MIWVDVTDPLVYSAVTLECPDPEFEMPDDLDPTVEQALTVASQVLNRLSGYKIHPAGTAIDEFRTEPVSHRLTPHWKPVTEIISVNKVGPDCGEVELDLDGWCIIGQSVYFGPGRPTFLAWHRAAFACRPAGEILKLEYAFGSTVDASARAAVLMLARQIWLSCHPDEGSCQLPERVTSVNREGLSYTVIDPMTFLDQRRTGLPSVDLWLTSVNPSKAMRPAGIYSPDSPPPTNRRTRRLVTP